MPNYSEFVVKNAGKRYKKTVDESQMGKNKKKKIDCYSIENIVVSETNSPRKTQNSLMMIKNSSVHCSNIIVPDFVVIPESYYLPSLDRDSANENEEESHYSQRHKNYELAEMCGYFLNVGQGIPKELESGLKVTPNLSKTI